MTNRAKHFSRLDNFCPSALTRAGGPRKTVVPIEIIQSTLLKLAKHNPNISADFLANQQLGAELLRNELLITVGEPSLAGQLRFHCAGIRATLLQDHQINVSAVNIQVGKRRSIVSTLTPKSLKARSLSANTANLLLSTAQQVQDKDLAIALQKLAERASTN